MASERYEEELELWAERLKLVDALLEKPIRTMIGAVSKANERFEKSGGRKIELAQYAVPTVLRDRGARKTPPAYSYLVHVTCCSMLQRVRRKARRLRSIDSETRRLNKAVDELVRPLLKTLQDLHPRELVEETADEVFGKPNPLNAAETLWLLVNSGERNAHARLGFFSLFVLLWALSRRSDEDGQPGVAIADWRASALLTAKCLLPIERLTYILRNRAGLYGRILEKMKQIQKGATGDDQHSRWQLASGLEELASALHDFAEVATNPEAFRDAAERISDLARPMTPETAAEKREEAASRAVRLVIEVLEASGRLNLDLLAKSKLLLDEVAACGDLFDPARARNSALKVCSDSLKSLEEGARLCVKAARPPNIAGLRKRLKIGEKELTQRIERSVARRVAQTMEKVAKINVGIAEQIDLYVQPNVRWLRRAVTQEIAFASAGNETDFDAAELLSALVIVERWMRISDLEVEDAIRRSISAARADGSWSTGQPIFLKDRVLGVWPNSPELVWLLTTAIERKKKIRYADDVLFAFVRWLDKTKIDMVDAAGEKQSGWPSEARDGDAIDLWSTALSINALLGIRDIIEHRLWELCERRFYVTSNVKSLWKIDPVDIGARHEFRLHRRLMNMARDTRGERYESAEYALILHGPPGSSKTAIAEALASEMWKGRHREPRLIRITPADFTRQGESRVDSEARFIFDLISRLRGVTVFFDEIDDLLQKRRKSGQLSFLNLIVPAMLNRLQDLRDAAPRQEICFLLATNFIDSIEPALTRPGRIDSSIPVPYPDPWSRKTILERHLEGKPPLRQDWKDEIIDDTPAWPWSTFNKLCKEIGQRPPNKRSDLEGRLNRLREQFEDPSAYYHNASRWTDRSRPLINEYVHSIFSRFEDPDRCLAAVDDLGAILERDKSPDADYLATRLRTAFWKAWRREERPEPRKGRKLPIDFGSPAEARPGAQETPTRTTFRVWAPNARSVSVAGTFNRWSNTAHPLKPEGDGMWAASVDLEMLDPQAFVETGEPHGMYRFVITNSDRRDAELWRVDPYAAEIFTTNMIDLSGRRLSNGVAVADPESTSERYIPPLEDMVIYQLHPAAFGGREQQLEAIIAKLDYLEGLGVNMIELLVFGPGQPTAALSPDLVAHENERELFDAAWGYNAAFPFALHTTSGGASAFARLIDEAHRRKIGVLSGLVCHRLGREQDDLWQFDGGRRGDRDDDGGIYYRGVRKGEDIVDPLIPDFDLPAVRNFFVDNATRWMDDRRISGFRWTRPALLVDRNTDPLEYSGFHVMRRINGLLRARDLLSIAEDSDDSSHERTADLLNGDAGAGCDVQWSQRFMQVLHANINVREDERRDVTALAGMIPGEKGLGIRRVLYSESYEEARKGRIPRMEPGDPWPNSLQLALLGAAMVFTSPGVPMLFEGQEFADRTGFELVNGEVRPVNWDAAILNAAIVEKHRKLIALRRNIGGVSRGLRGNNVKILGVDNDNKVLAFLRWDGGPDAHAATNDVVVAANFSGAETHMTVNVPAAGDWQVRFDSEGDQARSMSTTATGELVLHFAPYGIMLLSQDAPTAR